MSSPVGRVLVQGGGIGGLTAAAALAQRGVEVDVVEAAHDEVVGVGLNVPANALGALATLGVRQQVEAAGWTFEPLTVWDATSTPVATVAPPPSAYGTPSNVAIARPVYAGILRAAAERAGARITSGTTVVGLHEDPDGVDVQLGPWTGRGEPDAAATGEARYDVVVGFDGIRSALRRRVFGTGFEPRFTGFAVWRVTMPRPAEVDGIVLCMAREAKAVLTPIGEDSMYIALVTPEPGNPRQDPDRLVELVQERMAPFSGLVGDLRDGLDGAATTAYTPIEEVNLDVPWHRGRVVVAGDAAHATTPHLAQGGAMAVEDAVVLAESLTGDAAQQGVPSALLSWYERRLPRAGFVQRMSSALLRHEMGAATTPDEADLLELGMLGAQRRLAEPY